MKYVKFPRRSKIFGKNFDECGICLSKMYKVSVGNKLIGFKITALSCGHCFHSSCINKVFEADKAANKTSNQCPLCQNTSYSKEEMKILTRKKIKVCDLEYISSLSHERAMTMLKTAIESENVMLTEIISSKFDPSEILHYYISNSDVNHVAELLKSKFLNWHRTCNGKTIFDASLESSTPEITQMILDKFYA